MNKVHIVVDSTANVPAEALHAHANLHVVPIKVILGDQVIDEPELTAEEIFEFVEPNRAFPKTSQPAPGEFSCVLDKIIDSGNDALVITLSSAVSGTNQCARSIAKNYDKNRVIVIDSRSAGIGLWYFTRIALELADAGLDLTTIAERIMAAVEKHEIFILPSTLEYLHKGGRIGGASAFVGSLLKIKPLLTVEDGKIEVLDKVRTHSRALTRMIENLPRAADIEWIGLTHTETPENVASVIAEMQLATGVQGVETAVLGSALAVHFGPGMVAFFVQKK